MFLSIFNALLLIMLLIGNNFVHMVVISGGHVNQVNLEFSISILASTRS
jgi:hypothetical protein